MKEILFCCQSVWWLKSNYVWPLGSFAQLSKIINNWGLYWCLRQFLVLPIQVGVVVFHCARAPGTAWHQIALDPFNRYPGLHSNRTTEPTENSELIRLPYRGSGTELHWLSLVRGTATIMRGMTWFKMRKDGIYEHMSRETLKLILNWTYVIVFKWTHVKHRENYLGRQSESL